MSETDQKNLISEVPIYLCYTPGFAFWESGWEAEADSAHTAAHLQTAGADGAHENTPASRG